MTKNMWHLAFHNKSDLNFQQDSEVDKYYSFFFFRWGGEATQTRTFYSHTNTFPFHTGSNPEAKAVTPWSQRQLHPWHQAPRLPHRRHRPVSTHPHVVAHILCHVRTQGLTAHHPSQMSGARRDEALSSMHYGFTLWLCHRLLAVTLACPCTCDFI